MESFFSRYKFDQITEIQSEEYLTFFTMCIDNLSLTNFFSILSGDIFVHFDDEDYRDEYCDEHYNYTNNGNYVDMHNIESESILMSNEDINILNSHKCDFVDVEIVEYTQLNEFLKNQLSNDEQYLDKTTTLHNLKSLSKLERNQKLWLYQNEKKIDVSNGYSIAEWLSGQSSKKIISCVILTVQSALQPEIYQDLDILDHLNQSIDGLNKLITLYPENEELINTKILIKSKLV